MAASQLELDQRPCAGEERRQGDGRVLFLGSDEDETEFQLLSQPVVLCWGSFMLSSN